MTCRNDVSSAQQRQHVYISRQLAFQRAGRRFCSQRWRQQVQRKRSAKACCQAAQAATPFRDVPSSLISNFDAFVRFSRPHTMVGTLVSLTSVSLLAMKDRLWTADAVVGLLTAILAALAANVSIVGVNQCCDIEVDRVNKPYLPLASGEWSAHIGWWVSAVTGFIAVTTAVVSGSVPLMVTVIGSILLGLAYSLPNPALRWKRFPVAAAACIITVRSLLVQVRAACNALCCEVLRVSIDPSIVCICKCGTGARPFCCMHLT